MFAYIHKTKFLLLDLDKFYSYKSYLYRVCKKWYGLTGWLFLEIISTENHTMGLHKNQNGI